MIGTWIGTGTAIVVVVVKNIIDVKVDGPVVFETLVVVVWPFTFFILIVFN